MSIQEAILVCVGPGPDSEKLVRRAALCAGRSRVVWHAIVIETPAMQRLPEWERARILGILKMAQEMGAQTAHLSGQEAVNVAVSYARENELGLVLVGRDRFRRFPWRYGFAEKLARLAPDLELLQIAREDEQVEKNRTAMPASRFTRFVLDWRSGLAVLLIVVLVTLGCDLLHPFMDQANIVMVYLLAVVYVALRLGRAAAVWAAFLSVAFFDFLFVPPRMSFVFHNAQYLVTLLVMLTVALVVGQLTAGLRFQLVVAGQKERRMHALYQMARDLSSALRVEQIVELCHRFFSKGFHAQVAIFLPTQKGDLALAEGSFLPEGVTVELARLCFAQQQCLGLGGDHLPELSASYFPMRAPTRLCGVLVVVPREPHEKWPLEQWLLLETCVTLIAIAMERIHYVILARETQSEGIRNSLLSAISHDLRTPLTVITGLVEAMAIAKPALTAPHDGLLATMREQVARTITMVNNLLEMARMQMGQVVLNRDWYPLEEVVGVSMGQCAFLLTSHEVHIDLPLDLPWLELDGALMERVFNNLLENAAKHTPSGSQITLSARREGDNILVMVCDNGPGLPSGQERKIFDKFMRGRKESAVAGFGLGLAIVRFIVEAHGGTVWAKNREEGGAGFYVRLPAGDPPVIPEEPLDE